MARRILPHAPDTALAAALLAMGEVAVNETTGELLVGDGSKAGGIPQATRAALEKVAKDVEASANLVTKFGAKCDGVTDDTAAVQAAIDDALSVPRAKAIRIPGRCRITSPLIINRQVDTTNTEFRIIAEGPGAGFYVDGPMSAIIETTLPVTLDPLSEFVTFEGIHFECSDRAINVYAISPKFLRMKFHNCYFYAIKVVNAPDYYLQSWYFLNCNFRGWSGWLISCKGNLFDVDLKGCIMEFGENGIRSTYSGGYSLRLIGNLFEGSKRFVQVAGGNAMCIIGNYTEGNSEPDYTLVSVSLGGATRGTTFIGNQMTPFHGQYNVIVGDMRGFFSAGNYCSDKMFDVSAARTGRIKSCGDYAEASLFSDPSRALEVQPEGMYSMATDIAANPAGVINTATQLTKTVSIVTNVPVPNAAVQLPASDMLSDGTLVRTFIVVNKGANNLKVTSSYTDFQNFGTNLSWIIPPGKSRTFIQHGQATYASVGPDAVEPSANNTIDPVKSNATASQSAAAPTKAEFDALVDHHNTLVAEFNAFVDVYLTLRASHNDLLTKMRAAGVLLN